MKIIYYLLFCTFLITTLNSELLAQTIVNLPSQCDCENIPPGESSTRAGCAAFEGVIDFSRTGHSTRTSDYSVFIDADGKLRALGPNTDSYGKFGVAWNLNFGNDPAVFENMYINGYNTPYLLPNFETYLPGETFNQVDHWSDTNYSIGAAVTTSGKLYTWGESTANQGQSWVEATGRTTGTSNVIDANTPHEIIAPNGQPWEQVYINGRIVAHRTMFACTADGTWYSWGESYEGVRGLAHTSSTSTAANTIISTPTPAPVVWSPAPICGDPHTEDFIHNQLYKLFIATDGTARVYGNLPGGAADLDNAILQLPAGVNAVQVVVDDIGADACTLILGDDGNVYFTGNKSQTNPHGTLTGTATGLIAEQIPNMPAGVSFTKILLAQKYGYGLGDDGNIYFWGDDVDPTILLDPGGEIADVEEFWIDHNAALFFKKTDGSTWFHDSGSVPNVFTDNPIGFAQDVMGTNLGQLQHCQSIHLRTERHVNRVATGLDP